MRVFFQSKLIYKKKILILIGFTINQNTYNKMQNTFNIMKKNIKIKSEPDQLKECNNDLESACHKKKIPLWLVLLDNLPTLLLTILGALLIYQITLIGAIGYVIYSLLSIVWFWAESGHLKMYH